MPTAQRVFDRLVEGDGADDISYSMGHVYVGPRLREGPAA